MLEVRDKEVRGEESPDLNEWLNVDDRFEVGWDDPWMLDQGAWEAAEHPFPYPAGLP